MSWQQELMMRRPKQSLPVLVGSSQDRVVEYKPLLDAAIKMSEHKPDTCIIFQRPQAVASMVDGRDLDWDAAQDGVTPAPCVDLNGNDPVYILVHVRNNGPAKGCCAPYGWAFGRAELDDEKRLWHGPR